VFSFAVDNLNIHGFSRKARGFLEIVRGDPKAAPMW